jgi:hypothetical protein
MHPLNFTFYRYLAHRALVRYTEGFKKALEPFGLDPTDPAFWKDSLDAHLGSLMEEAEALASKLGYAK